MRNVNAFQMQIEQYENYDNGGEPFFPKSFIDDCTHERSDSICGVNIEPGLKPFMSLYFPSK